MPRPTSLATSVSKVSMQPGFPAPAFSAPLANSSGGSSGSALSGEQAKSARADRSVSRLRAALALCSAVALILISGLSAHAQPDPAIPSGDIRIHYFRPDGNYSGWTVYAFVNTTENTGDYNDGPVPVSGSDSYGVYFDVGITSGAQEVGIIIHNPTATGGDVKDTPYNLYVDPATQGDEFWEYSGIGKLYNTAINMNNPTALLPGYARIHYYRPDGAYANWTVYAFDDTSEYTGDFNNGLTSLTNTDSFGAYFDIALISNPQNLGMIIHNIVTDVRDTGSNLYLNVGAFAQGWVISGETTVFPVPPTSVCPGEVVTASCSYTVPVQFNVPSGTTVGSTPVTVVTQGAPKLDFNLATTTCANLTGPNPCTAEVTFAPFAPGFRLGAVELTNSSNNPVASNLIFGLGQGPAIAFGPGTQTPLPGYASGMLNPAGVAVDAAGDVFVADNGHGQVLEFPSGGGTAKAVATGLNSPFGVAVDGAGDVFFSDSSLDNVQMVPPGCTMASCRTTVYSSALNTMPEGVAVDGAGDVFVALHNSAEVWEIPANGLPQASVVTGLSAPAGVAVDAAGDIFVADRGLHEVLEFPAGGGASSQVGSGLNLPVSVAVDAAGDAFIADAGAGDVVEVLPSGCVGTCQFTVGSNLMEPFGVAVDGTGDIFIADFELAQAQEVNRHSPTYTFPATRVGNASPAQPFSYQDIGNESLTISTIDLCLNSFTYASAGPVLPGCNDQTINASVAPGAFTGTDLYFLPQTSGPVPGTETFTDNALNAVNATQIINLSGMGLPGSYLLTTGVSPSGGGVVTPASGNSYTAGTPVPLVATPDPGYVFSGWSGAPVAVTGAGSTASVTMGAAPETVTAYFTSALTVSPATVTFGQLYLDQAAAQTVKLTNTGSSPLTISKIVASGGTAPGDYGQINSCAPYITSMPGTLAAGKTCTIAVGILATAKVFSPTASTSYLTITSSAAGSPDSELLTATVINPVPSLSALSLNFSQVKVGTNAVQTLTIKNKGNTPVDFTGVTISGNFVILSNTCTGALAATTTASCTIGVEFTPKSKGLLTGTLKIADNALIGTQTVLLTGTGK